MLVLVLVLVLDFPLKLIPNQQAFTVHCSLFVGNKRVKRDALPTLPLVVVAVSLTGVRFRPTATMWFIVLAPFLTFYVLSAGWLWGLYILFVSHLLLAAVTLVPSFQGFGPVLTKYWSTTKTVWLTIDDGPDPGTTPQVLALLKKYRARATFFLIGAKAARYPELTRMILEAGHTIGNHTQTHPRFSFWRFGPGALVREIDEFEATISSIGVAVPIWFRAPAGFKNPFLHPILAARGLQLVGWSARAFPTASPIRSEPCHRFHRCSPLFWG